MPKESECSRVIVALDESNHGRYPEIIVALYSFVESDSNSTTLHGRERMDEEKLAAFLSHEGRGFRYLRGGKGEIVRNKHQLVQAAPCLVDWIMRDLRKKRIRVNALDILIDGGIRLKDISEMDSMLLGITRSYGARIASIDYYPKSEDKSYEYPKLLIAADSLAHALFRKHRFAEQIGAEERIVRFCRYNSE